jgi:hypothetical protein
MSDQGLLELAPAHAPWWVADVSPEFEAAIAVDRAEISPSGRGSAVA